MTLARRPARRFRARHRYDNLAQIQPDNGARGRIDNRRRDGERIRGRLAQHLRLPSQHAGDLLGVVNGTKTPGLSTQPWKDPAAPAVR